MSPIGRLAVAADPYDMFEWLKEERT